MTDLRQAAQQALEALIDAANVLSAPMFADAVGALKAALEQQQAEPPPEWPLIKNILAVFGLDAIAFVAEWRAAQQQAEPVAREGFERWAKSLPNYIDLSRFETGYSDCNTDYAWVGWQAALAQPQQQAEPVQERITRIAWDERGVRTVNGIPDDAPQRPWLGLTDDEITEIRLKTFDAVATNHESYRAIEAKLKEKNDH